MSKSLRLIEHKLSPINSSSFDLRPKKIKAWIASLPKANLGETSRLVYQTLYDSNRINYPYQDRTQFLELLQEQLQYVTRGMAKHFINVSFPLTQKSKKIAALCQQVNTEISYGYILALEKILTHNRPFSNKKLLTLLLHRIMTCLSREILNSYQLYFPYRKFIWRDIHKIYSIAKNKKLHEIDFNDIFSQKSIKSTICEQYKRILLLSLASPYCLRHGEITKIYHTLGRCSKLIDLNNFSIREYNKGTFTLDNSSDKPPRYLAIKSKQQNTENLLLISTEKLTAELRTELQQRKNFNLNSSNTFNIKNSSLSNELLIRLLTFWEHTPKRIFPRNSKVDHVSIALGLNSAHKIIFNNTIGEKNSAVLNNQFKQSAQFKSSPPISQNTLRDDVWNKIYPTSQIDNNIIKYDTNQNLETTNTISDQSTDIEQWEIVNESANGYCIRCFQTDNNKAQVGELIAIRRNNKNANIIWAIGVVCWMKSDHSDAFQLGIQMITPKATAIGIKTNHVIDRNANYHRSLLLPEQLKLHQAATLITASGSYRVGDNIDVIIHGNKVEVELNKLISNTGLYAQFEFSIINNKITTNSNQDSLNNISLNDIDLKSLWFSN